MRKGTLLAASFSTANVLAVYVMATNAEKADGMLWYTVAHNLAGKIADGNIAKGAGILAALSPSMSWGDNVAAASLVAMGEKPLRPSGKRYQSKVNEDKATAIYNGECPDEVLKSKGEGINQTQKVTSFYACIKNPQDPQSVCVDRHAYSIAIGRSLTDKELTGLKKPEYDAAAECYREAAAAVGILPSQIQAICWVTWRRLKGLK